MGSPFSDGAAAGIVVGLGVRAAEVLVGAQAPIIQVTWSEKWEGGSPPLWVNAIDAEIDADVLVIQRPLHRQWTQVIPLLQAKGVRVVCDLDDNFDRIDQQNEAFWAGEPHWLHKDEVDQLRARFGPRVRSPKRLRTINTLLP